jgi:hypothetical protein
MLMRPLPPSAAAAAAAARRWGGPPLPPPPAAAAPPASPAGADAALLAVPHDRRIAVDAGAINLAKVVEDGPLQLCVDGTVRARRRQVSYGVHQYYADIRAKSLAAKSTHWMASNPAVVEARRMHAEAGGLHARVGTTAQLLAWVQLDAVTSGPILDERLKLRWARQEARTKSKHRAAMMRFWAGVARGNAAHGTAGAASTTVAYGSANFAATRPGCLSAPTVSFDEAAVKVLGRLNTWRTPEWGSTLFSACHGARTARVRAPPTRRQLRRREARQRRGARVAAAPPALSELHGLLACTAPGCCRLLSRDGDAALSIGSVVWALLDGQPRPAHLVPHALPLAPAPWVLRPGPPGEHRQLDARAADDEAAHAQAAALSFVLGASDYSAAGLDVGAAVAAALELLQGGASHS